MSDKNKKLGDELDDIIDDAKDDAKKALGKASKIAQEAKKKAKEACEDAKKASSEFSEGAKGSAKAFVSGAKEVASNKKVLAGILGILFGGLGIHKFILGYQKEGFILLGAWVIGTILSCLGIGLFLIWILSLIGLIEGIIYLTKSDEDFYNTYQADKKPWF